jgi:hypothetical protein
MWQTAIPAGVFARGLLLTFAGPVTGQPTLRAPGRPSGATRDGYDRRRTPTA